MYKLKTKTAFSVQDGRTAKSVIIRMIVSHCSLIDINNVKIEGYYYYLTDENDINSVVKLPNSDFGQSSLKQWDDITSLENMENSPLANFVSNRNLMSVLFQRIREFTWLQLQQESGENWGTTPDDWEEDNN